MTEFASLQLAAPLMRALSDLDYKIPTPIQTQAIPLAMQGDDVMGLAQTGTGKTAAFTLPLLDHICRQDREPPKRGAHVLILAPTRELVGQITEQVLSYGRHIKHLSVVSIYGGVPIVRHIKRLSGGADIIVATPGRLIDLLERGSVQLSDIEKLVLDEADQMMDMGFIHALRKILPLLPENRQTLFFSATMLPKVKKLAAQFLQSPKTVSVTPPNSTASKIEQRLTFANKNEKPALLALCLLEPDVTRAIVFTRTKHGADRLVKRLRSVGLECRAIHGNKSQGQRQRALDAFRKGELTILIATDVAARGIDIPRVSHVFNYEIPNVAEQYVHRIGRTARAERSGVAHAFVSADERAYLKDIQKLLKKDIPQIDLPEGFIRKAQDLKKRPALAEIEKPKEQTRKGRGKSRNKSRREKPRSDAGGSKAKRSKSGNSKREAPDSKTQDSKLQDTNRKDAKRPDSKRRDRDKAAPMSGGKGESSERVRRHKRVHATPKKPSDSSKPSGKFSGKPSDKSSGKPSGKPSGSKPYGKKSSEDKSSEDKSSGGKSYGAKKTYKRKTEFEGESRGGKNSLAAPNRYGRKNRSRAAGEEDESREKQFDTRKPSGRSKSKPYGRKSEKTSQAGPKAKKSGGGQVRDHKPNRKKTGAKSGHKTAKPSRAARKRLKRDT